MCVCVCTVVVGWRCETFSPLDAGDAGEKQPAPQTAHVHHWDSQVNTCADSVLQVIVPQMNISAPSLSSLCRVFSCHLLRLCKLHPSLVVDQSHDLLEFAGTTANAYSKEEVYTHVVTSCVFVLETVPQYRVLQYPQSVGPKQNTWHWNPVVDSQVWALGEYLSVSCDSRCSVKLITSCFETLEAVLFEVTSSAPLPGAARPAPRVITSLMSALAKLASRSHDLIPRWQKVTKRIRDLFGGFCSLYESWENFFFNF